MSWGDWACTAGFLTVVVVAALWLRRANKDKPDLTDDDMWI